MNEAMKHLSTKIVVTGASGRIGSHLLFLIAQGALLGADQPVQLFLLEKESNLLKCRGIQMELEDAGFPLLQSVHSTHDLDSGFADAEYLFICGAKSSHHTNERDSIRNENWRALTLQGEAINRVCTSQTLCLMIANPCNTNTLALIRAAPRIPPTNFHAMMRLDFNRGRQFLSEKANCIIKDIENLLIWGNHSETVVPDWSYVKVHGLPIRSYIDENVLLSDFTHFIQRRGMEVTLANNGRSSCASAAYAAIEAMKALIIPTDQGLYFCSGIHSHNNPFSFDQDLVFGMPCRTASRGIYKICENYSPPPSLKQLIALSEAELIEERSLLSRFLLE